MKGRYAQRGFIALAYARARAIVERKKGVPKMQTRG
jgi:hypothetical protein